MDFLKRTFTEANISKFFNSREFVWLWAVIVFICWISGGWIAGLIIAALLMCFILSLCRDTMPAVAILWTFLFMIGINRHKLQGFAPLISAVAFIVIGLIVNVIRFRPSFKFLSYKTVKATTVGTLAFCATVMLSGIAMHDRNLGAAFIIIALCVLLALGYLFFSATISGGEDGKRFLNYVLFLMLVSGVLITVQLFVNYIRMGSMSAVIDSFTYKTCDLGWGGPNNYSIILAMMIPSTIFYAVKHGKFSPLFLILAAVQFLLVLMSGSRGATLFGGLILTVALGYAVVKSEYRARMVITLIVLLDITLFAVMLYGKEVVGALSSMLNKGLDASGRGELYRDAIELFKWQPIFGVGFDYRLGGLAGDGYSPFWYHSTFFQSLASTGIVGFLALAYLAFSRYRTFLTDIDPAKLYLLAGFLIFDLYALTDVFFFTPNGLLYLFIMTLAAEKALPLNSGRPLAFTRLEMRQLKKQLEKNE